MLKRSEECKKVARGQRDEGDRNRRRERREKRKERKEHGSVQENGITRAVVGRRTERGSARRVAARERRGLGGSSFMAWRTKRSGDKEGGNEGGRKRHA